MDEHWDDVELIVRSWDEPEAFGVVFERHAETLLGYFARRTLDPEAAAELTAETFAQAASGCPSARSRPRTTNGSRR
jgi:RNA polymerase sigma-70 factor, ECF subfamily